MRFVHPEFLWLLTAIPLLALLGVWTAARRRAALRRFAGGNEFLSRFTQQVSTHRRVAKTLALTLAFAAVIVAAARPQWGTRLEQVKRKGIDVMVVLDTSLSMAAEDLAPNRLGQARNEIDHLLEKLAGNRVGLVTFAGQASLSCPLTLDHSAVRLFLDAVEAEAIQVPGTALAEALKLATQAFGNREGELDDRDRAIVLFTDGEDHEGGLDEAVRLMSRANVTVHAVGTATLRGAPIPLVDDDGVTTGYKKDREDKIVTTQLGEEVLERLALDTDGRYYRASVSEVEVDEIIQALLALDASEFGAVMRARYEERFQFPLLLALLALIVDTVLGDRRRGSTASTEVQA